MERRRSAGSSSQSPSSSGHRHQESPTRQYLRLWYYDAVSQLRGDVAEGLRSQTEQPEAATEAAYLPARSATASKTLPAPRGHRTELHPPGAELEIPVAVSGGGRGGAGVDADAEEPGLRRKI